MTRKQKIILLGMGAVAFCVICVVPGVIVKDIDLSNLPTSTPAAPTVAPQPVTPTPLQFKESMAQIKCERFIKAQLKAPSTAKFFNARTFSVKGKPANYHAVTGVVEAQNLLGVPLRSTYRCDAHYLPDSPLDWVLDNLEIK